MTTVGYGDMVPHSIPGQMVALTSILSGILIMAFPATSIFHTFSRSYQELKQEYERLWKEEKGAELSAQTEDDLSNIDFGPGHLKAPSGEDDNNMMSGTIQQATLPATAF